jgi:uncharacterized protein (TIGR00369 family)
MTQPSIKDLLRLPGSPGCVVCDNNGSNSRSLAVTVYWDEATGTVHIPCRPDNSWCGYENVVHGGVIASVLDEAMSWAVKMHLGDWGFTADFNVRYKKTVNPGKPYRATATVVKQEDRMIRVESDFKDEEGVVYAHGKAIFLPGRGKVKAVPKVA